MPLVPCPSCSRHVHAPESPEVACPFCRGAVTRSHALAFVLTSALALAACGKEREHISGPAAVYGGPPQMLDRDAQPRVVEGDAGSEEPHVMPVPTLATPGDAGRR